MLSKFDTTLVFKRELLDSEANIRAFNTKLLEAGIGMVVRHDITY